MAGGTTQRTEAYWIILWTVLGVALTAELVLLFVLPSGPLRWLRVFGCVLFGLSAVFGWLPIFFFRRHGRVAKGKSYMHTTALVTRGPYATIRHPQYLAADLLALAIICIVQHWSYAMIAARRIWTACSEMFLEFPSHQLRVTVGQPRRQPILQPPCLFYGFFGLALGHIGEAFVESSVTE